ncbi:MAG: arginine--tRNA ligase [Candidatus Gracilibacteria bacterium]|nr:arginine--tRNA ligase [Candidatus Gracilibacteria bacterium]
MLKSIVTEIVNTALPQPCSFTLETPPQKQFGDLACNAALILAKELKQNPREVAQTIAADLAKSEFIEKVEIAGPGFLNLFLKPTLFHQVLVTIEKAGKNFGSVSIGKDQKVNLEFISANPTGPLTIANGRGGFGGDVLARVLIHAGCAVSREYYINDAGNQIVTLGKSLQAAAGKLPEAEEFYKGEYIKELAAQYPEKITADALETGKAFAAILLEERIKPAVAAMGVTFDRWFAESELHSSGLVEAGIKKFGEAVYEKDGALWLATSKYGDDKDRVLRKADGELTYFAADIAYHADKFSRGFDKLIDIWGADHHGYIGRMQAAVEAFGRKGDLQVIITQLVKLYRDGEEFRMSKRRGNFELMSELLADVGMDVARWFFIMRDWNTHLNFDLDLAKKQSNENPVFYVQYAHTRLASILAKASDMDWKAGDLSLLTAAEELALIQKLSELPSLVADIASTYAINILTTYASELAQTFHKFYEKCRVIDEEDSEITKARLRLVASAKEVLRIVLEDLVGVSAPEKM